MKTAVSLLVLLAITAMSFAFSNIPPRGLAGNPPTSQTCTNCHSSYPLNSGNGSLDLTGLPFAGYFTGQTYHLTLSLNDPGQSRWGFELTVQYMIGAGAHRAGNLVVTDPVNTLLQIGGGSTPDYLVQISAGTYRGSTGPVSWNFDWTAPSDTVGMVTFYFAGNAANNNNSTSGDYIYNASVNLSPAPAANLQVTLTPHNPPIQIPAAGGNFTFDASILNATANPIIFDAWTEVVLPNGSVYGPLILRSNLSIPAGATISRIVTQTVPGYAPSGQYTYRGLVGTHPGTVVDSDEFNFTKSGVEAAFQSGFGWRISGFFEETGLAIHRIPEGFRLSEPYPNPFNPQTNVEFYLPVSSEVRLAVYDISGREIAELQRGWTNQGSHNLKLDLAEEPSGIYFIRMEADGFKFVRRIILLK